MRLTRRGWAVAVIAGFTLAFTVGFASSAANWCWYGPCTTTASTNQP